VSALRGAIARSGDIWFLGALAFALIQGVRIGRVMRRVRTSAAPAQSLVEHVETLGRGLRIRPIRISVVAGITSPVIWSGNPLRPHLLWPADLSPHLSDECQRGLIVHELAHVKRRDHWVGWLELVAGCAYWWNPLFWYVRSRLRETAELACDGWVVDALPQGRRAYAEALLAVCAGRALRAAPIPAVGVSTGSRRCLERRLAMIMRERVPLRLSRPGLVSLVLLTLAILPAWTQRMHSAPDQDRRPRSAINRGQPTVPAEIASPGVAAPQPRLSGAQLVDRSAEPQDEARVQEPMRQAALNQIQRSLVVAAQVPTGAGPTVPLTMDDAVKLALDRRLLVSSVRNAYWDFVYATQAMESTQQSLALSAQLVADNRTRIDVGTMAPLDVVTAQKEQARNEEALLAADTSRRTSELALKRLLVGTDDPKWAMTLDPIDRSEFRPEPVEVAATIDRALRAMEQQGASEITVAAVTLRNTAESVQVAQAGREQAQRRLEAEQRQFDDAMSTNYQVVEAQRSLNDARLGELRTVLNYRKAQVEFDRLQTPPVPNANIPVRSTIDVAAIIQNTSAPTAPANPTTVCNQPFPPPLADPPANSGPVIFLIAPCFAAQGSTPLVPLQTYIYYMQITQRPSRPSQGIWTPYDAAAEQTIRDDYDRLWRTNFLAKLSIETSDYTFSNGVVGKIVVYNMEERPRVKIVDFVGSKQIATSKLDARLKKEHVELRLDTFLDEATIRKVETIVRAMMVEKGFRNAVVTSEIQPLGSPTLVHLRFHIDEGHQRASADRQSAAR
jgi:hypothetical protein